MRANLPMLTAKLPVRCGSRACGASSIAMRRVPLTTKNDDWCRSGALKTAWTKRRG